MHPASIPRGVEVPHPSAASAVAANHSTAMFEPVHLDPYRDLLENDTGSAPHYGDLIRSLLMTSCSAPVIDPRLGLFRTRGFAEPQWSVDRHQMDTSGHYHSAMEDVSAEASSSAPPECRRPSVVVAPSASYWFDAAAAAASNKSVDVMDSKEEEEDTDGSLSRPPSVQILSPPPRPSSPTVEHMDVATLRQIDEFEELIEKIDRLNDMRGTAHSDHDDLQSYGPLKPIIIGDGGLGGVIGLSHPDPPSNSERARERTSWTTPQQTCLSTESRRNTGKSAIDDDLETLLEENPSLLDIPGVAGGATSSSLHLEHTLTNESRRMNGGSGGGGGDFDNDCDDSSADGLKCNVSSSAAGYESCSDVDEQQCQTNDQCDDDSQNEESGQRKPVVGCLTTPVPTRCFGPPTSLKSATMTTRTNLKQLLQMQQFHEMERKEQSKTSPAIAGPTAVSSTSPVSVPMQPILPSRMEVPSEVLKVHSRLENPTRYHVQENQKRQVQEYLSTTQGNARSILAQSVPNTAAETSSSATMGGGGGSSAPLMSSSAPSPGSPNSVVLSSSAATSVTSEADVIESIMQLESSMDVEHAYLHQTSTFPTSANFMDVLKMNSAKSCPADVPVEGLRFNDNQLHALAKDRQKKDNHNMIERRRRFNINDRIKELGTLLPRSNDPYYDMIRVDRQNKGTILKATVDYVKQMKRELDRMKLELGEKDHENRKLRLQNVILFPRAQQLAAIQSHSNSSSSGIEVNWSESLTGRPSSTPTSVVYHPKEEVRIKEEPVEIVTLSDNQHHHLLSQQMSPFDDLMDEDEPVHGDPLLSSSMLGNTL